MRRLKAKVGTNKILGSSKSNSVPYLIRNQWTKFTNLSYGKMNFNGNLISRSNSSIRGAFSASWENYAELKIDTQCIPFNTNQICSIILHCASLILSYFAWKHTVFVLKCEKSKSTVSLCINCQSKKNFFDLIEYKRFKYNILKNPFIGIFSASEK